MVTFFFRCLVEFRIACKLNQELLRKYAISHKILTETENGFLFHSVTNLKFGTFSTGRRMKLDKMFGEVEEVIRFVNRKEADNGVVVGWRLEKVYAGNNLIK
jgi:hypothetical protein